METNRVKERVFYMSCFDRFTKLKRKDEIEVFRPVLLPFDKFLSGRRTQSGLRHFIRIKPFD